MESDMSACDDETNLRDDYRECLMWIGHVAKECSKEDCNVEHIQFYLNSALASLTNLFYKEFDESRRKSIEEVVRLLSYLNKKLLERLNEPVADQSYCDGGVELSLVSLEKNDVEPISRRTPPWEASPSFAPREYQTENFECDKQAQARSRIVEQTLVVDSEVGFSDVIGLNEAKRSLNEAIVMPTLYPHLFSGKRKPWKRILLYGPPGTGKTRLAYAVAKEIDSPFYSASCSDILSSWFGESEKTLRSLFDHARKGSKRSVIFMDEIDSLCRRRTEKESESVRNVKTELLNQLDGKPSTNDPILLCSTNCPWEIDSAFLRRFQKRIYIPLPSLESRISIMKFHVGDECNVTDHQWKELGSLTDGYSGSDLATLVNSALFEPVRQLETANIWVETENNLYRPSSALELGHFQAKLSDLPPSSVFARVLEMSDLSKCLQTSKATVQTDDLARYDLFTAKFGQNGT